MTNTPPANSHYANFEDIRKEDEYGVEYWSARELAPLLEYQQWRNFVLVIGKAKQACAQSGSAVSDHFADVSKMVSIGSTAQRSVPDVQLSRYACYLIVQNGDPAKPVIANGQTYFAIQTRRQELEDSEQFTSLTEDDKRLAIRKELIAHNKDLAAAARDSGVETPMDYAIFQDHGYKGLYGGLGAKDLHARKGLKKSHKILDFMGSTELAANLFRATQAEEKLRRDGIQGKQNANNTHFEVGQKVRQTIGDLGGDMPEHLPTPDRSVKQVESAKKKLEKKQNGDSEGK